VLLLILDEFNAIVPPAVDGFMVIKPVTYPLVSKFGADLNAWAHQRYSTDCNTNEGSLHLPSVWGRNYLVIAVSMKSLATALTLSTLHYTTVPDKVQIKSFRHKPAGKHQLVIS
jgi:hypothetical protein